KPLPTPAIPPTAAQKARLRLGIAQITLYASALLASIVAIVSTSHGVQLGQILAVALEAMILLALLVLLLVWLGRRTTRRRRTIYSVSSEDWMSRLGYFLGPYEDPGDSKDFFDRHSRYGRPPQGYLIVTSGHIAIASAGRPFEQLTYPFSDIEQ